MLDSKEELYGKANELIQELNILYEEKEYRTLVNYVIEQVSQNGFCDEEGFNDYINFFEKREIIDER